MNHMSVSFAIFFGFVISVAIVFLSSFVFNSYFLLVAACLLFLSVVILYVRSKQANSGSLMLLVLTSFLFLWGRAILGIIDSTFDISIFELREGVDVSDVGLRIYLEVIYASMVTFSVTLLCLSMTGNYNADQKCMHWSGKGLYYLASWKLLFNVGVVFSVLQAAFFLRHFMSGGNYYEIFALGKDVVTFPGLSFLAGFLFIGYVGVLVFSGGEKIRLGKYVFIFVVVSLLQLIKGSRGEVFSQILVGLWLYYFNSKRSPKPLNLLVAFLGLVILAEFVSFLRADDLDKIGDDKDVLLALKWFIYSQGASGELVGVAVDFFEVGLNSFRFVVSPLLNPFRRLFDSGFGGQTVDYGESSGLLAHEISWRLSPDLYLSGHGVGTSYIAESFLAMGLVGVIVASSLMIYLVSDPRGVFNRSKIGFFVFACSLPYILFTPRESLVFFVVPAIKAYVMLIIVNIIYEKFGHRYNTNLQSISSVNGDSSELPAKRSRGGHSG